MAPFARSLGLIPFRVLSAKRGKEWDIVLVESGLSDQYHEGIRIYLAPEMLEAAASKFEGKPIYAFEFEPNVFDHMGEQDWDAGGSKGVIRSVVGYTSKVRFGKSPVTGKPALLGRAVFLDEAEDVTSILRQTLVEGQLPDFAGLSISYLAAGRVAEVEGIAVWQEEIVDAYSTDIVSHPAAGGAFYRMVAGRKLGGRTMLRLMSLLTALSMFSRKRGSELIKRAMSLDAAKPDNAKAAEVVGEIKAALADEMATPNDQLMTALDQARQQIKAGELEAAVNTLDKIVADLINANSAQPAAEAKTESAPVVAETPVGQGSVIDPKVGTQAAEVTPTQHSPLDPAIKAQLDALQKQLAAVTDSLSGTNIEAAVTESGLPAPSATRVVEMARTVMGGKSYDPAVMRKLIADEKNYLAALSTSAEANLQGMSLQVHDRTDENLFLAFEGFFMNEDLKNQKGEMVPRFTHLHEARRQIMGRAGKRVNDDARELWNAIRGERADYTSLDQGNRLGTGGRIGAKVLQRRQMSLASSDWASVFADVMHNVMLRAYASSNLQDWRKVVEIVNLKDLNPHNFSRVGGSYGQVPTVAEKGTYQELTDPGDEGVSLTAAKYGGLAVITLEMVMKDRMREIQKIPGRLGQSIAQDRYRDVFDLYQTNAAIYDGVTLIHAATHANGAASGGTALTQASWNTCRTAMMDQTAYNNPRHVLGLDNLPSYLLIPTELEQIAFALLRSPTLMQLAAATGGGFTSGVNYLPDTGMPSVHQDTADYIVVPHWTDADNWFAVADPRKVTSILVGFLNGDETPEILTEAANSGSDFYADKKVFKVRQWCNTVVADYRGIYGQFV